MLLHMLKTPLQCGHWTMNYYGSSCALPKSLSLAVFFKLQFPYIENRTLFNWIYRNRPSIIYIVYMKKRNMGFMSFAWVEWPAIGRFIVCNYATPTNYGIMSSPAFQHWPIDTTQNRVPTTTSTKENITHDQIDPSAFNVISNYMVVNELKKNKNIADLEQLPASQKERIKKTVLPWSIRRSCWKR